MRFQRYKAHVLAVKNVAGIASIARRLFVGWGCGICSAFSGFGQWSFVRQYPIARYHRRYSYKSYNEIGMKQRLFSMVSLQDESREELLENDRETLPNPLGVDLSSLSYLVTPEYHATRLDSVVVAAVASSCSISRSCCATLISDGHVTVNGKIETRKSFKVSSGMQLVIDMASVSSLISTKEGHHQIVAEELPLSILYEDEYMIVLNKAAGMVVHPGVGNFNGTVVNALAYYLSYQTPFGKAEIFEDLNELEPKSVPLLRSIENSAVPSLEAKDSLNEVDDLEDLSFESDDLTTAMLSRSDLASSLVSLRPGIVHRLDKGTTGVLVVAKTPAALSALSQQFGEGGAAEKTYLAIAVGNPGQRVVIDRPIGRHPINRQLMRVVPDSASLNTRRALPSRTKTGKTLRLGASGKRALSFVDTIAFDGKLSFVKVKIDTGRTHQIRVHLQDRRTPIYGDEDYGKSEGNKRLFKAHGISRPMLHAFQLKLHHPMSGEVMTFRAPLPDDMRTVVKTIYPQGEEENRDIFATSM